MDPMIKITSIPISVEVVVTRGQFEVNKDAPKAEVTQNRDTVQIEAQPLTINLNSKPVVDSFSRTPNQEDGAFKVSYDGVATFSADANGDTYSAQRNFRTLEGMLSSLPESPVSWSDGKLKIQYLAQAASDISMDAAGQNRFEFIPGSIELIVKELPRVEIEYTGGPIYFPRSADPDYEPIVDITA